MRLTSWNLRMCHYNIKFHDSRIEKEADAQMIPEISASFYLIKGN